MVVAIELTRRPDGRYVARALHIPGVIVEAVSRDAALEQMRAALITRQRSSVEIVQLDLGEVPGLPAVPWPPLSGAFPDDEVYREMPAEIERQRRGDDERKEP
ncbi:MAG: hypothetical protein HXY37_18555 [Chloroflexi bacterium]|nr:hypothetical protein [Chloroflexota bacterium]